MIIKNKREDTKLSHRETNTEIDKKSENFEEINISKETSTIQRNLISSGIVKDELMLKSLEGIITENKRDGISMNSVNNEMNFSISVFANTEVEIPFLISSATSSSYIILGGGGIGSPGSLFHSHFSSCSSSHFGHANRSVS